MAEGTRGAVELSVFGKRRTIPRKSWQVEGHKTRSEIMIRSLLRSGAIQLDRLLGVRAFLRAGDDARRDPLAGDRAIEWSWVVAHLPSQPSRVLDLGCVGSVLTGIASRMGHLVTALDLREIEYEMPRVTFVKGNALTAKFSNQSFDVIINCSTIEHVGISDRYGSGEVVDGDLGLMSKMRTLLADTGTMILTVPVGRDRTYPPFHRVYGEMRLPRLLSDYDIVMEEFWSKGAHDRWVRCEKSSALGNEGSWESYALGLFVLG